MPVVLVIVRSGVVGLVIIGIVMRLRIKGVVVLTSGVVVIWRVSMVVVILVSVGKPLD